jgi:hypothetical protein
MLTRFKERRERLAQLQTQVNALSEALDHLRIEVQTIAAFSKELEIVRAIAVDAAGERAHYFAEIPTDTLARIDRVQEAVRAYLKCGEGEARYRLGQHAEYAKSPIAMACRAMSTKA